METTTKSILAILGVLFIGGALIIFMAFFIARRANSQTVFIRRLSGTLSTVLGIATTLIAGHIMVYGIRELGETISRAQQPLAIIVAFLLVLLSHELFMRRFGSEIPRVRNQSGSAIAGLEEHERRHGFVYYRNWLGQLGEFGHAIERKGDAFIKELLFNVFCHGPFEIVMPENVTHSTVFLFSNAGAVKFQRIKGVKRSFGDRVSNVYLPQTCSTALGETKGIHFARYGKHIVDASLHEHGKWIDPKSDDAGNFDIMLLAVYKDDDPGIGDYVYVDIPKYIDLKQRARADVEIAMISHRELELFNVWEVSASLDTTERPVPLLFRNINNPKQTARKSTTIKSNFKEVAKMLGGWDIQLDQALAGDLGKTKETSKIEVQHLLQNALSILNDGDRTSGGSFRQFFRASAGRDCLTWRQQNQTNVILTTFIWGEVMSSPD
jgi:hypothetical protein